MINHNTDHIIHDLANFKPSILLENSLLLNRSHTLSQILNSLTHLDCYIGKTPLERLDLEFQDDIFSCESQRWDLVEIDIGFLSYHDSLFIEAIIELQVWCILGNFFDNEGVR